MQVEQIDRDAAQGFGCGFCPDDADEFLAEAFARHRHQVRAEVVGEIVTWLREDRPYYDLNPLADEVEAKFGGRDER